MKTRFGVTIGPEVGAQQLGPIVDALERLGFDSLWIPEVLLQPTLDPIAALSYVAARTDRLKLGSHLIIPGRSPVHLARQLAHLDRLSGGRLLLVAVLGLANEADVGAQGIARRERGDDLAEVVSIMRRLWAGEVVTHTGTRHRLDAVSVQPPPVQEPLELWFAGTAPSALRRAGQLGDGWMPGLVTPAEAASKHQAIHDAAHAAGRTVDPEHLGVNLFYASDTPPAELIDALNARRPDGNAADLVPIGIDAMRDRIAEWQAVGHSKFLLRPLVAPVDWTAELEMLAAEILPLTT